MQILFGSTTEKEREKSTTGGVEEHRFTRWIGLLSKEDEPTGGDFDDVWTLLRRWVRRALQRRGMWDRRPVYLGILGAGSWVQHDSADGEGVPKGGTRDALDELVQEVYVEVFVKRLPTLTRYVQKGRTVEAVVRRAIDQAIHERQSARDPLGQRLYQWLRSAAQMGVDRGLVTLLDGGAKIQSASVLHLGGRRADGPSAIADLDEHVRLWNDELFVDWLTAKGRESEQVVARLADLLLDLPSHGIDTVRFEILVQALTRDTRSRLAVLFQEWQPLARIWTTGEADAEPLGAWDDPRIVEEARDRFQALAGCVEQRIDGVDAQQRTREQLRRLWRLLGIWARAMATGPGSSHDRRWSDLFKGDGFPSDRELGRLLSLRHDRIKDLMTTLKQQILPCLESTEAANLVSLSQRDSASAFEPDKETHRMSSSSDFRQQLLAQSLSAARKSRTVGDGAAEGSTIEVSKQQAGEVEAASVGRLWDFGETSGPEAEWLVLEVVGDRKLLVPVDGEPWCGSRDLRPRAEPPFDRLVARVGLGFWTASDLPGSGSTQWSEAVLEPLRRHRSEVEAGRIEADDPAWETDVDPDYRSWIRALDQERRRWIRELGGEPAGDMGSVLTVTTPVSSTDLVESSAESQTATESQPAAQDGDPLDPPVQTLQFVAAAAAASPSVTTVAPVSNLRSLAMAASLLAAVGAGVLVGRLWHDPELDPRWAQAEEVREQLESENRNLREDLSRLETQSEQQLDALKAETETQLAEMEQSFEHRLDELDGSELVTGWLFVPPGTTRNSGQTVTLDPQARSVLIQVPAAHGDRVRLLRTDRGSASAEPRAEVVKELEVTGVEMYGDWVWRVPKRLLPPGNFMIEVVRDGETVIRHRFRVTETEKEEDVWP